MDWFKVGYLLVFQLGLDCLVRHFSLLCCFWGGLCGLVSSCVSPGPPSTALSVDFRGLFSLSGPGLRIC